MGCESVRGDRAAYLQCLIKEAPDLIAADNTSTGPIFAADNHSYYSVSALPSSTNPTQILRSWQTQLVARNGLSQEPDHIGILIAGVVLIVAGLIALPESAGTSTPVMGKGILLAGGALAALGLGGCMPPLRDYWNGRSTIVTVDIHGPQFGAVGRAEGGTGDGFAIGGALSTTVFFPRGGVDRDSPSRFRFITLDAELRASSAIQGAGMTREWGSFAAFVGGSDDELNHGGLGIVVMPGREGGLGVAAQVGFLKMFGCTVQFIFGETPMTSILMCGIRAPIPVAGLSR